MPSTFEIANRVAVLFAATAPEWVDQPEGVQDAPEAATDGVALTDASNGVTAPVVVAWVACREIAPRRTIRFRATTVDLTTTVYRFDLGGTVVTYDASVALPADHDALIAGLASTIEASAAPATATVENDENGDPRVLVVRADDTVAGGTLTVDHEQVGGVGALACVAEPEGGTAQVYGGGFSGAAAEGSDGPAATTWSKVADGELTFDQQGLSTTVPCGWHDRAALRLASLTAPVGDGTTYGGSITYEVGGAWLGAPRISSE